MGKQNKTREIHILLLIIGAILFLGGIIFSGLQYEIQVITDANGIKASVPINSGKNTVFAVLKNVSAIISSMGGVLFGLSLSWLIEYRYKKAEEREDSLDLFAKSMNLFERAVTAFDKTLESKDNYPTEFELKKFRKEPLHLYHSTKSEDGHLFWHHTVLHFPAAEISVLRKLVTTTTFKNLSKTKSISYKAELFRPFANDCITLALRADKTKEPLCLAVFDPCKENSDETFGLLYHDDWQDHTRISPCVLSFRPMFSEVEIGPINSHNADQLKAKWSESVIRSGKKIFEDIAL